jgi:hypothetical protein
MMGTALKGLGASGPETLSPLVPHVPTPLFAILLASTAAFAHLSWQISLGALIVDLFPKQMMGNGPGAERRDPTQTILRQNVLFVTQ